MACLIRQSRLSLTLMVASWLVSWTVLAWSPTPPGGLPQQQQQQQQQQQPQLQSRQDFVRTLIQGGMATSLWTVATMPRTSMAATETASLQEELQESRTKLQEIPNLLQAQEWDKVRSILKTPPVNKLWNLGDSQNTVLKLAKETGDVELFELKDELAYQLQMCDQLTYDNVFVYFQPGSGKIKIKEPTDSANKAMAYLDQILEAAK